MNKQQTAVEWLVEQFNNPDIPNSQMLFNQAKKMEKKQIIDAHNQGYADGYRDNGNSPIEYYNETFKK